MSLYKLKENLFWIIYSRKFPCVNFVWTFCNQSKGERFDTPNKYLSHLGLFWTMYRSCINKCVWVYWIKSIVTLTLTLLGTNFTTTKWCKNPVKSLKPWHMGTHLRVLGQYYPMNTNMTGFRWVSEIVASLCFGWKWPKNWVKS